MRSWRDEWELAQLRLRLRDDALLHGETVTLFVDVQLPPDSAAAAAAAASRVGGVSSLPASPSALAAALVLARRERWRGLCESARVDIRVVDESSSNNNIASSAKAPRLVTLFHQDAQLELVQDADRERLGVPTDSDARTPTLVFRCEVLLKVRSEHWDRPLKLLVRITPAAVADATAAGLHGTALLSPPLAPSSPDFLLADPFTHDSILRLIREEPTVVAPPARTVERAVRIAKPLQLKMETRYLSNDRVCIVAKARNTHAHLELRVLDLHLHLNEPSSMSAASSNAALPQSSRRRAPHQFRIVSDAPAQFPVRLRSAEQVNFVFVLEATHAAAASDDDDDDGNNSSDAVDAKQPQDSNGGCEQSSGAGDAHGRSASMSRNARAARGSGAMKRHSSSGSVTARSGLDKRRDGNTTARSGETLMTATAAAAAAAQTQQTLLTLSWEASTGGINGDRNANAQARPITELHTIIWSPQNVSGELARQQHGADSASAFTALAASSDTAAAAAGIATVRLDAQSALSLSLAPLTPQQAAAAGEVTTLCLVVTNRSRHTSFDLTLLAPFAPRYSTGAASASAPGWFSFEATHRLGVVPPGMTVRKSVRAVLLRIGKCDLNRFALFDHLSRTCFVPSWPLLAASSCASSSLSSWAGDSTSSALAQGGGGGGWALFVTR